MLDGRQNIEFRRKSLMLVSFCSPTASLWRPMEHSEESHSIYTNPRPCCVFPLKGIRSWLSYFNGVVLMIKSSSVILDVLTKTKKINTLMMRTVQLLILTFLFSGCYYQQDKLAGHWHSISSEGDPYWTLDITDSTTQVNKYDIETNEGLMPRFDVNDEELIIFLLEEYKDFEIRNDTLILADKIRFTKVTETSHHKDRFLNSFVRLDLPETKDSTTLELPRPSQTIHLFIGPPKSNGKWTNSINPDSTCIQIWDMLATYSDIENFVRYEDDKIAKDENNWLVIHSDSTTSATIIDSLKSIVEPLELINGYFHTKYNYQQDELVYEKLMPSLKH